MQLNEKRKTSKVTQRTPELSWPPSVTDLERQEKDMPCSVEEFLETLQCSPDHPNQERARLLVQSYSNDLIFGVTRGKLITLKHFLLGLGLHNLTGQKVLVQFLSQGGNFYWFVTGGQTQSIFEKPKNILHLGNFRPQRYTKPKNILKLGHL